MVINVTPREAQELIEAGRVEVIDVRAPAEWERGHVPGARRIALDELRSGAARLPPEGVLFVCAGGVRSHTAARVAVHHGVRRVYSLSGGTLSWVKAGLPLAMPLRAAG